MKTPSAFPPRISCFITLSGMRVSNDNSSGDIEYISLEEHNSLLAAAIEREKKLRDVLGGMVALYERGNYRPKDHACDDCCKEEFIHKGMIIEGFRCQYHEAKAALAATEET